MIAALCIEDGLVPGCLGAAATDPEFRSAVAARQPRRRAAAGAQQLLRLWRQQLRPADRRAGVSRLHCRIDGIGLLGPGPAGLGGAAWRACRARRPGRGAEIAAPPPALLPPTERRRTGLPVRLALAAAAEATAAEPDRAALETVFASGNGDGAIVGGDPRGAA